VPRRRRSQSSGRSLSPGQASYVLERLLADRRVSAGDVNRYIGDMGREIGDLERRLAALRAATGGGGSLRAGAAPRRRGRPPGRPAGSPASAASSGSAKPRRRRRRRGGAITAEQLASRKLQGKYLSLIRQIPASRRAQFSRIAKEKGREAAIRELQSAVK
jgi:hypothetical protein